MIWAGGGVRRATFAELDTATLYAILQLRVDVFVVEQHCAYRELDGHDTEPTTQHLWIDDHGAIGAYLRLLLPPAGPARIGRVVSAPRWRGRGAGQRLVRAALDVVRGEGERQRAGGWGSAGEGERVVLDAQAHLQGWYERLGFVVTGAGFVEDGIAHVPMALDTTR